jgi:hypothetical protein
VKSRRFREPAAEMLTQWIEAHCGREVDPTETVRAVIDMVEVGVGSELLRQLSRTRAYHRASGALDDGEFLMAGAVMHLIRETTGMAAEPGQPIEKPTRRGISGHRK